MSGLPAALFRWLLPFFAAVSAASAQESAPDADPAAVAILHSAASHIAAQDRIAVSWFTSFDEVIDGREKLTRTRSGNALLSRGEGFFAHTEDGPVTRQHYYDGGSYYMHDVTANAFAFALHNGSFETLTGRLRAEYGVVLPVWSVLSSRAKSELIDTATSAAYVGQTRIAGRDVHHIALSDYDSDWQIWVAADPDAPELVMLAGTNPYAQGWPQYRVYFTSWDFSPEIAPGSFAFTPDAEAERMSWPKAAPTGTAVLAGPEASQ